MAPLYTTIQIRAPPAAVRAVFLDFAKIPEWHKGFFISVEGYTTVDPAAAQDGALLKKDDRLKVVLPNMTIYPYIWRNNEEEFTWKGMLLGVTFLFGGTHFLKFLPSSSPDNPGGTEFIHGEDFTGIIPTIMFREGSTTHTKAHDDFADFGKDLKAKVEGMEKAKL